MNKSTPCPDAGRGGDSPQATYPPTDHKPFLPRLTCITGQDPFLSCDQRGPPSAVQGSVCSAQGRQFHSLKAGDWVGTLSLKAALVILGTKRWTSVAGSRTLSAVAADGVVTSSASFYPSLTASICERMQSRRQSRSGGIRQLQQGWDVVLGPMVDVKP